MSVSIWSARISVLRTDDAAQGQERPAAPTKPKGWPVIHKREARTDEAQRERQNDEDRLGQAAHLNTISVSMMRNMTAGPRPGLRRPCALLGRAALGDAVAGRQALHEGGERRPERGRHVRALGAVPHVGAHGQHRLAVAPPQDGLVRLDVEATDLGQRDRHAVPGDDRQVAKPST
jgi:hypothetical protein